MKAGVHDFVLKDRLARLAPAVARELREAQVRADRRRMQEQLLLSERLSSLGMLAASVAHEINNPLASLMMNLELVHGVSPRAARCPARAAGAARGRRVRRARPGHRPDIKVFSRPEEQALGPHGSAPGDRLVAAHGVATTSCTAPGVVKDYAGRPRCRAARRGWDRCSST